MAGKSAGHRYTRLATDPSDDLDTAPPAGAAAATDSCHLVVPPPTPEDTQPGTPNPEYAEKPPDYGDLGPVNPPQYTVATELPSYEEAARNKEAGTDPEPEPESIEDERNRILSSFFNTSPGSSSDIGTDTVFMCTFLISLVFNWVGFVISFCVSSSVAGRCGAISGFGLSLVKWSIIMRHSESIGAIVGDHIWVWWLILALGMMIFVRGVTLYLRMKQIYRDGGNSARQSLFYL